MFLFYFIIWSNTFLSLLESHHPILMISKMIAAKLFNCPENQIKLFHFAKLISLSWFKKKKIDLSIYLTATIVLNCKKPYFIKSACSCVFYVCVFLWPPFNIKLDLLIIWWHIFLSNYLFFSFFFFNYLRFFFSNF